MRFSSPSSFGFQKFPQCLSALHAHIWDPHSIQIEEDVVGLALQTGVITSRDAADPAYMTPASKTSEELLGRKGYRHRFHANYALLCLIPPPPRSPPQKKSD